MAKGWSMNVQRRAAQQRNDSNFGEGFKAGELGQPSKAELRASIPPYDPSMIKKIPPKKPKK